MVGSCVPGNNARQCVATKESCEKSTLCIEDSECHFDADDGCVATAALCARGPACSKSGRCGYNSTLKACRARSQLDCRRSQECKDLGMCKLDAETGMCMPGLSP